MADNFESWLSDHVDVAAETVKAREAVWHNHLHTGETVRTIRRADRTAGKVALHRTNGNGLNVARHRSTVGAYTRSISRSAEAQYVSQDEARRVRLAVQGVFA